jgi:glutamate transport system permease protein
MSGPPAMVLFDVPGPKARGRHLIVAVVGAVAVLALLAAVIRGLANPENNQLTAAKWKPFLAAETWTAYLIPGLGRTLLAAAIAVVLSLVIGVLLGIGRLSGNRIIRSPCGIFVEFFRSVPVLMMMLFAFFFGLFILHISGAAVALFGVVAGLTFYNSCVIAELIRSGVNSLPRGQREAGLAIGLTGRQTLTAILLPQAITAMLPSLVSQLVVILKDTALGYIITYPELLRSGQNFATRGGNLIPTLIVIAALFILINYGLSRLARYLEARLRATRNVKTPPADPMLNPAMAAGASATAP